MVHVEVQEAEARLSELLRRSERGGGVVIVREGQPVARLVPVEPLPPRRFGAMRLDAGRLRRTSDLVTRRLSDTSTNR